MKLNTTLADRDVRWFSLYKEEDNPRYSYRISMRDLGYYAYYQVYVVQGLDENG